MSANYLFYILIFIINVPFGYLRALSSKYSLAWFATIHIPVIISIYLRYIMGIEYYFFTLLSSILIFFFGQWSGKIVFLQIKRFKNLK